jgi:hypothetical protein
MSSGTGMDFERYARECVKLAEQCRLGAANSDSVSHPIRQALFARYFSFSACLLNSAANSISASFT